MIVFKSKYWQNNLGDPIFLKAWFMENVANSIKYTKDKYTFIDLDLGEWAKENNLDPLKIAIKDFAV
jgi:hypothetical protein